MVARIPMPVFMVINVRQDKDKQTAEMEAQMKALELQFADLKRTIEEKDEELRVNYTCNVFFDWAKGEFGRHYIHWFLD